ncbi:MAG TPA: ABC transporter ATP-binding protein [Gaiellaceae bacterium]|nr:ABC transporter ATP-binding protein [Gaiellaceae bacterium]
MHADAAPGPAAPLLAVEGVTKRFAGVVAVNEATFSVAPGSITALIGPNGAGKSTLFNVITGFLRGDGGDVRFAGESIAGRAPHAIARRGLVRTFQLTKALAVMSVLDNMLLAAPGNPGERLLLAPLRPLWRGAERSARARALELLEVFGLAARANDYAGTLSGGQRKLLELARALMLDPRLLLLDEPLAGVNRTLARALLEHVQALRAERGVTILLVEHDMEVVMEHSDAVVVMAEGRVVTSGPPAEVRRDPRVVEAYLGAGGAHASDA